MTYKDNFVIVIKSNGKILRDNNREVLLPFESEYTILLKNLDSRQAVASVSIDGKDVLDGVRVIVPANESVELKGEMDGNKVRYRFKFIEKTEQISEYRGDRVEDGLIRVEVWFEKPYTSVTWTVSQPYWYIYPNYTEWKPEYINTTYCSDGTADSMHILSCCTNECTMPKNINQDGITVKGSDTKQDFINGCTDILESQSTVITLCLKGYKNEDVVTKPIFTTTKYLCPTCGKHNKSLNKFCGRCGTRLSN